MLLRICEIGQDAGESGGQRYHDDQAGDEFIRVMPEVKDD